MLAPMERTSRDKWRERVRRWKASGLTAEKFAASRGFSASNLWYWSWRFRAENRGWKPRRSRLAPPCVEIIGTANLVGHGDNTTCEPFEVLLESPLRVRVPSGFDPAALRRLIAALERS